MGEYMDYRKTILERLVDKYERSGQRLEEGHPRRRITMLTAKEFPDYLVDTTSKYKEEINLAALALKQKGWVDLIWQRYEEGNLLDKVVLNVFCIGEIHSFLGRTSLSVKEQAAKDLFSQYWSALPEWAQSFAERLQERLSNGKGPGGYFNLDDLPGLESILKALAALPGVEGEIPKRVFSVQVLGNSKLFEVIEGPLLKIIKEFFPGADASEETDRKGILAEFGIVDNPQYVYLSGQLKLSTDGDGVDLGLFRPAVGLPVEMIRDIEIVGLEADTVLSVENLTSFYQLAKAKPEGVLLVYLGGYHNRHRRKFFLALKEFMERSGRKLNFAHWGDIDLGGFSILVDLDKKTGLRFTPVAMDEIILGRCRDNWGGFDKKYGEKLRGLFQKPGFERFFSTIKFMLENGCRLEQEAVNPIDVIQVLEKVSMY
jgi:hypothetical protein